MGPRDCKRRMALGSFPLGDPMRLFLLAFTVLALGLPLPSAPADSSPAEANLASYAMGAWIVKRPSEYGEALGKPAPAPNVTGTWSTNFSTFHMVQEGATLTGCYEWKGGLVRDGGIEGRVARFTWVQDSSGGPLPYGPTFFAFSADGKQFLGLWWYETRTDQRGDVWRGTKVSDKPGTCAHWKGTEGASKQMAAQLERGEKARIYGIHFDLDSDPLRDDSKAALESIAKLAQENPAWRFVIEGHTDGTGSVEHNKSLSERRAAAVKAWVVKAGIAAERLKSEGFGATRPVAGNDTGMGRAQNRRAELARLAP